jgi:hypothetical protein
MAAASALAPSPAVPDALAPVIELPVRAPRRDVALDLLRGLAMVILVVNHVHLQSLLEPVTTALLSAAEILVAVSGVVVGMVFGRRWRTHGALAATTMLLLRARKLYVASVVVVALVGALMFVPGLATEAVTVSPTMEPATDLYAFDGAPRTLLAILTLEAGPWQFNILGFFIVMLAAAPALLWTLERGWWPAVLALSWALYAAGRTWPVDVLPSQSERPFPVLVWQLLFVHGIALGWYRERIARALRAHAPLIAGGVVSVALAAAYVRLHGPGAYTPADWARWELEHFDKTSLDLVRVVTILSVAAALYLALRRWERAAERLAGWLLLPLGRNSFYVFIMHVFLCLAVASVPALAGDGLGLAANTAVQFGCLALLVAMVRRRFLFRWVPR